VLPDRTENASWIPFVEPAASLTAHHVCACHGTQYTSVLGWFSKQLLPSLCLFRARCVLHLNPDLSVLRILILRNKWLTAECLTNYHAWDGPAYRSPSVTVAQLRNSPFRVTTTIELKTVTTTINNNKQQNTVKAILYSNSNILKSRHICKYTLFDLFLKRSVFWLMPLLHTVSYIRGFRIITLRIC
jgi:hypothetical protein